MKFKKVKRVTKWVHSRHITVQIRYTDGSAKTKTIYLR